MSDRTIVAARPATGCASSRGRCPAPVPSAGRSDAGGRLLALAAAIGAAPDPLAAR
jgi:hypothetical protein